MLTTHQIEQLDWPAVASLDYDHIRAKSQPKLKQVTWHAVAVTAHVRVQAALGQVI